MIVKTIVPGFGDPMYYIGKPVKDKNGVRIGGVVEAVQNGDCVEISMEIPGVYTEEDLLKVFRRSV
jgi:hypothetical protein